MFQKKLFLFLWLHIRYAAKFRKRSLWFRKIPEDKKSTRKLPEIEFWFQQNGSGKVRLRLQYKIFGEIANQVLDSLCMN